MVDLYTAIPASCTIINLILLAYLMMHPSKVDKVVEKVSAAVHRKK